ncbi:NAD(P)H-quinone oxidoreductase subunit 5, chloroplastic-like [Arachis duranensis]|uniref:NAD(P)H-quinone oxidoreductase subunit 5, chloroplastic-like n=1 Tax=Arachis duranensis TaxID=130453 RepID=A0A9C6TS15_ARADU|nr:NAD(P)H-quinone oxidoreductase subunit 5, chloroplastic-like [Arachis duranensis]
MTKSALKEDLTQVHASVNTPPQGHAQEQHDPQAEQDDDEVQIHRGTDDDERLGEAMLKETPELLFFSTVTKNLQRRWAFLSILLLGIVMLFSVALSIDQINNNKSFIYQYVWSWTINNDLSLEFGYLIDSLTLIMLILITTVGILVLIYSDNYMSQDQGYLRFFAYEFFNASMLRLVTSLNLIQIYIFWELVGMCSYLLIGFWFTRPIAANACQKAFVTNCVGDFGLLLGILGLYWITGSLEFRDLFQIFNNLIFNNYLNVFFVTLCALLLFCGSVAKSAQFPLHVWLPDAMEGPTPISALIHAATMVAAGIFLVARLLPLFIAIPTIMNGIAFIGIITLFLGATLAIAQKDIKRNLIPYMMTGRGVADQITSRDRGRVSSGTPESMSHIFRGTTFLPRLLYKRDKIDE